MQKLFSYLPFHFLTGLILGIWLQYQFSLWRFDIRVFIPFVLLILSLIFILKRKFLFVLSWLFFAVLGVFLTFQNDDQNQEEYYANHLTENNTSIVEIKEVLKSNAFSFRYTAEVLRVDSLKTVGKIILNIRKDSVFHSFQVDDRILIRTDFVEVKPPLILISLITEAISPNKEFIIKFMSTPMSFYNWNQNLHFWGGLPSFD